MVRLLLVSNSYEYGKGYLDHCVDEIHDFLAEDMPVLFVPYALSDWDWYEQLVGERLQHVGHSVSSIHRAARLGDAVSNAQAIFVGGGNTFRLLNSLRDLDLIDSIRSAVRRGVPYVGVSAGANLACPTIQTTNDMPIVWPPNPRGLELVPFQINPHYYDQLPGDQHMGESRATRLHEYHEENSSPVIALREGSWVRCEGSTAYLSGIGGAKLFLRGEEPLELAAGARLDFLLER